MATFSDIASDIVYTKYPESLSDITKKKKSAQKSHEAEKPENITTWGWEINMYFLDIHI